MDDDADFERSGQMALHRFVPTHFHNVLGSSDPVLQIADGDTVITTTLDAGGRDHANVERASRPNPMTGPFFVEGAEPDDALIVQIQRMTPTRSTGWTYSPLAPNVVDPEILPHLPKRERVDWAIDPEAGTVRLVEPPTAVADLVLPLSPMIGCFGVAPGMGQAISTATSGRHGGNMDFRGFGPGAAACFPVFEPGALFFLGDGHACQGDGEIVGTGIETSFEIEFTIRLKKNARHSWPRGETPHEIFTIGNARPLDQALQHATTEMLRWLGDSFGLDPVAASHLLGQTVCYDIGNVFNPAYTVVCRVAKTWLRKPVSDLGWLG
jgi:amidase